MKKMNNLFFAGALVSALCVGFTACNEPGGREQESNENEIQALSVSDEITAFFDENIVLIASAALYEQFHDEERYIGSCITINSMEEFLQIDFRGNIPPELPSIDFDSHTLIIGLERVPGSSYDIVSRKVIVEDGEILMNIKIASLQESSKLLVENRFYWGLYPKLPTLPVRIVRNYLESYENK